MSAAFGQVVIVPAAEKDIITILNTVAKSAEKGPKKIHLRYHAGFSLF